jgi:hypothetical protein
LCDYNTYWPREGSPFADGEAGRAYATLNELRQATGHELHGEVADRRPQDLGLDPVTFRVPDAKDSKEVLTMIGNGGCEWEDPAGVNILPYFWRAGTGDRAEHQFVYAAYTGLPGGVDGLAYGGGGGTVALRAEKGLAHHGKRCLEVIGVKPDRIPADGLGYWSPSLPARPGDTIEVTFWLRGKDLQPTGPTALAAFAEFTNATGQQRQRVELAASAAPAQDTFGWREIKTQATVPATARRVAFFFGIKPSVGTLWLDDIEIGVREDR